MQSKYKTLIIILITSQVTNSNILGEARELSLTRNKCPKETLSYYISSPSLEWSEAITPEISDYCPKIKSTCCKKKDLENLLEKFISGQNFYKSIEEKFKKVLKNFHTQRKEGFQKIKKADEKLRNKCKEETKLDNIDELLIEAGEIEEVVFGKLKSMRIRNELYYAGFACNLCNGTVGSYFLFNEDEQRDEIKMNYRDVQFSFRTYEVYFDILAAFSMIADVAKINLCLNEMDFFIFLDDKVLQEVNQQVEKCRPLIQDISKETNFLSKEMKPCLKLISEAGFLGRNEILEFIGNNLNIINYGISLNEENPEKIDFELENTYIVFFRTLTGENIKPMFIFNDEKNSWNFMSNTLNYEKWREIPIKNFSFFFEIKMMICIFIIFN